MVDHNGDVYVLDHEFGPASATLYKFTATGEPITFPSSGTDALNIPTPSETAVKDEIAVSPAGADAGDIFVENAERVEVFSPEGDPLPASELAGGEVCGVATGPTGDIYVASRGGAGHVDEYSPTETYIGSLRELGEICNIAVDSEGALYSASTDSTFVAKYPASEFHEIETGFASLSDFTLNLSPQGERPSLTLGVDPLNDELYVNDTIRVTQYSSEGAPISVSAEGSINNSLGVGVAPGGKLYVSDNSSGVIKIYGAAITQPPEIESTSAYGVSSTAATLQTSINPNGVDTRYHFEYGHADCANPASACAPVPTGAGVDIGGDETSHTEAAQIQGLAPETTYHYRVVANTSAAGVEEIAGPDHTFTTQGTGGVLSLPDNRGWELVSPVQKNGSDIAGIDGISLGGIVQAAPNGDSITYVSRGAFAGAKGSPVGVQYLTSRTTNGEWATDSLAQSGSSNAYPATDGAPYRAFSTDLQRGLEIGNEGLRVVATNAPAAPAEVFGSLDIEGASPNLEHVVIPVGGEADQNLDEWSPGLGLRAINVLPGGTAPVPGAQLGSSITGARRDALHAISDDGARAFFEDQGALYVRKGIYTSEPTTELIAEGGRYWDASSDGSKVLYEQDQGLFEFDVDAGHTTVLDPAGGALYGVMGASEDGSYVYFVAGELLGVGGNAPGSAPLSTQPNLYVWHDGGIRFIGTLSAADESDWELSIGLRTSRVLGNGSHAVFLSSATQTLSGYDNRDVVSGTPDSEVYKYDADSRALTCVSCDPSDGRPTGPSSIPGGTSYMADEALYQSRVISADGSRVFFDSADALVPQDGDGVQDVYEWENGKVALLSGGVGNQPSSFVDASASGDDVFFVTAEDLAASDLGSFDLYDARVDGGASPEVSPPICFGTGCQGLPEAPPIFATPASESFTGVGNFESSPTKRVTRLTRLAKPKKRKRMKRKLPVERHPRKQSKKKGRSR